MRGVDILKTMEGWDEVNNFKQITEFLDYHSHNNDIAINVRQTPWCAAMVNACERAAGNPGNGKLNARSFLTYGKIIYNRNDPNTKWGLNDCKEGDIVVFERGNDGWSGHVAYFLRKEGDYIVHLGGNQWSNYRQASDEVSVSKTLISKLLGVRRYETVT